MRVFVGLLFVFLLLSGCGAGGTPDLGSFFFNVAA
jgi:Tfp pilus assembly protein PilP